MWQARKPPNNRVHWTGLARAAYRTILFTQIPGMKKAVPCASPASNANRWADSLNRKELQMQYVQMKYYPKEVYYENRDGVNYIILDYGDSKVKHVIAAQQGVQRIAFGAWLFGWFTGFIATVGVVYYFIGVR
jgi:hypothetical protein